METDSTIAPHKTISSLLTKISRLYRHEEEEWYENVILIFVYFLVCTKKGLSNDDRRDDKGHRFSSGDAAGSWFQNRRFPMLGGLHRRMNDSGIEISVNMTAVNA